MSDFFSRAFQLSTRFHRSYLLAQLIFALLFMASYLVMMQPFLNIQDTNIASRFVIRGLIDGATLLLITHLLLRPVLKFYVAPTTKKLLPVFCSFLYLTALALVSSGISMLTAQLELLKTTQIDTVSFNHQNQQVLMEFSQFNQWLLGGFNSLIVLLGWSMIYLFWHNMQQKKQLQHQMQQTQIQQLTYQLSPHFLFNALNSVRALIFEDQHQAAQTVTHLSELLRIHLQTQMRPVATLAEEWQTAEFYLHIEQVRLEQRLETCIELAEDCLTQKLPGLTVLTLIENAIKHGISPNAEPGWLKVKAGKTSRSVWVLSVSNSYKAVSPFRGTGSSLTNLQQRLQLQLGDNIRWQQTKTEQQFEVRMELPYV
ncbi:putative regulator of cell autolysis [Rheinheimera sp. A13L]|uniref:sensor histidine kinase n=1 Tax=Rheinheimera sp. A13L TaxID=506534 RepID=UPI0002124C47|nr:histidine kinase [Rheinheimera sp. A13L]EGM76390.1 putative regulator of cell autolysis [Rheinheimera sp. A13L]